MSHDSERPLLADEAERTDGLRTLTGTPYREPLQELFELSAFYVLIAAAGSGVVWGVSYIVPYVMPDISRGWEFAILGLTFFGSILAINWNFDIGSGEGRKKRWQGVARSFAFPITLAVGLYLGGAYNEYAFSITERASAENAAIKACLQTPGCLARATQINLGNDVLSYLAP